jgi:hypothetical protein
MRNTTGVTGGNLITVSSQSIFGMNAVNPLVFPLDIDGPVVSAFRRTIAEVKQRWSVIGWVTK